MLKRFRSHFFPFRPTSKTMLVAVVGLFVGCQERLTSTIYSGALAKFASSSKSEKRDRSIPSDTKNALVTTVGGRMLLRLRSVASELICT
jgi:hypothetical protein